MSVVSVNEARMSRSGSKGISAPAQWDRAFLVETNDIEDGQAVVLEATGIPDLRDPHPDASYMVCKHVDAKLFEDDFHWMVTVNYSIEGVNVGTSPDDDEPKISFGVAVHERVADKHYIAGDTQGLPTGGVLNSAKDPFDPPVMDTKYNMVISVTRNESLADFDPNAMMVFEDTINTVAIDIAGVTIAPYEGWMRAIKADKWWDAEGDIYYSVAYEIEVDRETFIVKVLDRGFYELGLVDTRIPILDTEGNLVQEPFKLDGNGRKLSDTSPDSVYLDFYTKWRKDFNTLNLPTEE